MAKYYVLSKTLWQGDKFTPIAGAFTSKEEAQKVADEKAHDGWNEPVWSEQHQAYFAARQDLKAVRNTIVVTQTAMKRDYGFDVYRASEIIWEMERREEEQAKDKAKFLSEEA